MGFRLCFAFLVVIAVFSAAAAAAHGGGGGLLEMEQRLQNDSAGHWPSPLGAEVDDDEWALPSETARRFLQSGGHITYNAMKANQPAGGSGKSGQSYNHCSTIYNCKP